MNKFFLLFFPLFLFGEITFPYTFSLKKDETAVFDVFFEKRVFPFKMRWTLFKNDVLVVIYHYDSFPRQVELFKNTLNTFKVKIVNYLEFYPYLLIEFSDFNDKIATFKMYLFRGKNVKVKRIK
jgi:hypothetical protein